MAIDEQTLQAAKQYVDEKLAEHQQKNNPHPKYVRMMDADGEKVSGKIYRLLEGQPLPPPIKGSALFAPGPESQTAPAAGVYLCNRAGTAWELLGVGTLPVDTTPPTVPGNFRVTGTTTSSITVAWNASTDAEAGVAGYDISIDGGAFIQLGATMLSHTFSGLQPSSSHSMQLRARDLAPTPNVSAITTVSGTTQALVVPVVTNLRVTASATTSLTFAWNAPTGIPSGVTVTRYEYRLGTGSFASNGTQLTRQVTGLIQDTPYTFGVRVVYSNGTTSTEVTVDARTEAVVVTPPSGQMYMGIHVVVPSTTDVSNNPELQPVRAAGLATSPGELGVLNYWESEMRRTNGYTDTGRMHQMGHIFHAVGSNYVMKAWGNRQLQEMPALVANFKPTGGANRTGLDRINAGTDDNAIRNMITALPVGKRIYLTLYHEPDETTQANVAAYCQAQGRWARLILENRGARDVHPMLCYTTWSFRPANATVQAWYLAVEDVYESLGIDWPNQVVMGPDGYEDKSTAAGIPPDAAETYKYVFPVLKARGWKRFGLSEFASSSKVGQAGDKTITATDVTYAPYWFRSLVRYAAANNFEYLNYFSTTGSKGPVGHWMYTDAMRKTWGGAVHHRGPDPTWPTP